MIIFLATENFPADLRGLSWSNRISELFTNESWIGFSPQESRNWISGAEILQTGINLNFGRTVNMHWDKRNKLKLQISKIR